MKLLLQSTFLGLMFVLPYSTIAQTTQNGIDKIVSFPTSFFSRANKKLERLNSNLDRKTEKYLSQLAAEEGKIRGRLYKVDSNSAKRLFLQDPVLAYRQQISKLHTDSSKLRGPISGEYLPYADSLNVSLNYLNQTPGILSSLKESSELQQSLVNIRQLRNRFQSADQIKQYVEQRKQQFRDVLRQYVNNSALKKSVDAFNQRAYYCSEQIREFKEEFNDPDKILQKVLMILNKTPAFTNFMKQNSELAGLFNIPGNYGSE
jgi:hypothetical protein